MVGKKGTLVSQPCVFEIYIFTLTFVMFPNRLGLFPMLQCIVPFYQFIIKCNIIYKIENSKSFFFHDELFNWKSHEKLTT